MRSKDQILLENLYTENVVNNKTSYIPFNAPFKDYDEKRKIGVFGPFETEFFVYPNQVNQEVIQNYKKNGGFSDEDVLDELLARVSYTVTIEGTQDDWGAHLFQWKFADEDSESSFKTSNPQDQLKIYQNVENALIKDVFDDNESYFKLVDKIENIASEQTEDSY